jgi:hypothetical protein
MPCDLLVGRSAWLAPAIAEKRLLAPVSYRQFSASPHSAYFPDESSDYKIDAPHKFRLTQHACAL